MMNWKTVHLPTHFKRRSKSMDACGTLPNARHPAYGLLRSPLLSSAEFYKTSANATWTTNTPEEMRLRIPRSFRGRTYIDEGVIPGGLPELLHRFEILFRDSRLERLDDLFEDRSSCAAFGDRAYALQCRSA